MRVINNIFLPKKNNDKRYFAVNISEKCNPPSFTALKKSAFSGLDYAVIEKYKAPIEKFRFPADLQCWAHKMLENIAHKDFKGRTSEVTSKRRAVLQEWYNHLENHKSAYSNALKLIVFSALIKELKWSNDKLPPGLDKEVLTNTVSELNTAVNTNPKAQFDFNKMYETNLCSKMITEDLGNMEAVSEWIVIPSKSKDSKNFLYNVEKLKILSYKTWCTKSSYAEPYLKNGDFHIYMEKGKPKLGMRLVGSKVVEIQGVLNNGKIPVEYLDILNSYIEKNNLKLNWITKEDIEIAQQAKAEMQHT